MFQELKTLLTLLGNELRMNELRTRQELDAVEDRINELQRDIERLRDATGTFDPKERL